MRDQLFEKFLDEYGQKLNQVKYIIDLLQSYPIAKKVLEEPIISSTELHNHQKDWVWLCNAYDEDPEKGFFKPYWVPLDMGYSNFMDISDPNFPIYAYENDFFNTRSYFRYKIVENAMEFFCAISEYEVHGKTKDYKALICPEYFKLSLMHRKTESYKVSPENLFLANGHSYKVVKNGRCIEGKGFTPEIMGIFDINVLVNVKEILVINQLGFRLRFDYPKVLASQIACDLDPLYEFNLVRFEMAFLDYPDSNFLFENGEFVLNHYNRRLIDCIVKKLNEFDSVDKSKSELIGLP